MKRAGMVLAAGLLLMTSLPSFAQQAQCDVASATANIEPEGRLLQGRPAR